MLKKGLETPVTAQSNRCKRGSRNIEQAGLGRLRHPIRAPAGKACEDGTDVAVKVQVPKKAKAVRFALHPVGKILLVLLVLGFTTGLAVFTFYYVKYSRLIDAKLSAGPFANTSMLFAAPRTVDVGDLADPQEVATDLRRSGYSESPNNRMGYFTLKPDE